MYQDLLPEPLASAATDFLSRLRILWELALTPGWRQYQILTVLAFLVLAWGLQWITRGRWERWARSRQGWPKWRLRALIQVMRKLTLVYFNLIAWSAYLVMQQVTWPSRSYLIGVTAKLATAWLIIALLSRLVANRSLRRVFAWSLWTYATLAALNLVDDVSEFLDSVSFSLGEMYISVLGILKAVMLTAAVLTAARLITSLAAGGLKRNADLSPSVQVLASKAVQIAVYGIAFLTVIRSIGFDLTGLAVLSGAVGVGIGFGLQKVVSNLVSGVIILLDRSIKPGDVISLGDTFGWINALGARYVSVVTRNGREYLIPNEDFITSQVVNWSHSDRYVRLDLSFGTSYADNPHRVREVAVEAALSVARVLETGRMKPVCHITGFGDSSVDYVLRFWIDDPAGGLTNIRGNVYLALWDALQGAGFSIPFPQREVRMLNEPEPPQVAPGGNGG